MTDLMRSSHPSRAATPALPSKPAASPVPLDADPLVTAIFGTAAATIRTVFAAMDWAELEIAAAIHRHPGQADVF